MAGTNEIGSVEGQLVGLPLAGPETFSVQQLAYLKKALGLDETVLWANANGVTLYSGVTLSESRQNFETIRLLISMQTNEPAGYVDIPMIGLNKGSAFTIQPSIPFNHSTGTTFCLNWKIYISATDTTIQSTDAIYWGKSGTDGTTAGTWVQGKNVNVPIIYKVIGVHRIAGGN